MFPSRHPSRMNKNTWKIGRITALSYGEKAKYQEYTLIKQCSYRFQEYLTMGFLNMSIHFKFQTHNHVHFGSIFPSECNSEPFIIRRSNWSRYFALKLIQSHNIRSSSIELTINYSTHWDKTTKTSFQTKSVLMMTLVFCLFFIYL